MATQSMTTEPVSMASAQAKPKRYHPALVALHWLIALLILGTVLLVQENEGGERLEGPRRNFPQQGQQGNPPPQNFDADEAPQGLPQGGFPQEGGGNVFSNTGIHMILGISILVLLIIRLIVRWTAEQPAWATAGSKSFA